MRALPDIKGHEQRGFRGELQSFGFIFPVTPNDKKFAPSF